MQRFNLGEFRVDVAASELVGPNGPVRVEPKVMAVLECLARRPQEIVSREELRAEVWNGAVVVDEALQRIISLLRKALADNARAPRFIETVPKKGYRLKIRPEPIAAAAEFVAPRRDRRIGALTQGAAAAGFAALAGALLWLALGETGPSPAAADESIDNAGDDPLAHAHALYSNYRYEDNENAILLYEQATNRNPQSARAHAGLANALAQRFFKWSDARADIEQALVHARKAVRLAPTESYGHKALGLALEYAGDLDAALDSYLVALERDPGNWPSTINIGDIHYKRGEYAMARNWFARAHAAGADTRIAATKLAKTDLRLGRYDDADRWLEMVLERQPLHPGANAMLARIDLYRGDPAAAQARCRALLARLPNDAQCGLLDIELLLLEDRVLEARDALARLAPHLEPKWGSYLKFRRAHIAMIGAHDASPLAEFVAEMESAPNPSYPDKVYWSLAAAYALLGNAQKSFNYLERARAAGWADPDWDRLEPAFASLRRDLRFAVYLSHLRDDIEPSQARPQCGRGL